MAQQRTDPETIEILLSKYEQLVDDSLFLNCLRHAGVDNWDGYDYAQDEYSTLMGEDNG